MTSLSKPSSTTQTPLGRTTRARVPGKPSAGGGHWALQDAKARLSEVVRRVRTDGPQHVTVHGRDEVVIIAAEEFRRLKGSSTGQALIDALQASPHRNLEIAPGRMPMPVRQVNL